MEKIFRYFLGLIWLIRISFKRSFGWIAEGCIFYNGVYLNHPCLKCQKNAIRCIS